MGRIIRLAVRFLLLTIIAGGVSSCKSGEDNTAIPRRHAYPRIEIPIESYSEVDVDGKGLIIAVNEGAIYERRAADDGDAKFLDVEYPQFNSTIFYTITPVEQSTIENVIANRLERIRLNLGDADAELLEFDSPQGFENKVFVSHGDISTPVQFISTDGRKVVVSGVAFVKDASAATADSIAPIVELLRRDIVHALKEISMK